MQKRDDGLITAGRLRLSVCYQGRVPLACYEEETNDVGQILAFKAPAHQRK